MGHDINAAEAQAKFDALCARLADLMARLEAEGITETSRPLDEVLAAFHTACEAGWIEHDDIDRAKPALVI